MLALDQIRIRDPFVLPVAEEQAYYLFGTTDENVWSGEPEGFDCYRSSDLERWEGPIPAFRPPEQFWADRQFWAPEVHSWSGRYFMFATFAGPNDVRGTQVLVADAPSGPFLEWSDGPVTPASWQCLDGTLHVDADGAPWVVFCHEWLQVRDGAIYAQRLTSDLRRALGEPEQLFAASDAAWTVSIDVDEPFDYVTDGPWLRRSGSALLMVWSSRSANGYAMGVARSESGTVLGPWSQSDAPLWDADGGHGMIFDTFDGRALLTLHRPNTSPHERAEFHLVSETDEKIELSLPAGPGRDAARYRSTVGSRDSGVEV